MVYFTKNVECYIKEKLIYYKGEFNNQNILLKVIIKVDNKFYKLIIRIYYSKVNSKVKVYYKYTSNYSRQI